MSDASVLRRRHAGVSLGFALLAFVVALVSVKPTAAFWTDEEFSTATITAAELGPVQDLECYDNSNGSLLGLNLLERELFLDWDAPDGISPDATIQYEVTYNRGLLLPDATEIVTDSGFRYDNAALLSLGLNFRIRPVIGSWRGPVTQYLASQVSLLGLSVTVTCID